MIAKQNSLHARLRRTKDHFVALAAKAEKTSNSSRLITSQAEAKGRSLAYANVAEHLQILLDDYR